MGRRIVLLLVLALAVVASGCVVPYGYHDGSRYGSASYGGRYSSGGSYYGGGYGWPSRTVVVQRPVYVHRHVRRPHREHRREWVREHRDHRHDRDHDRRDWPGGRRRR